MTEHPNNLVSILNAIGCSLADLSPAYPGKDVRYIDQVLRDNALALSRPVIPYGLLGIHPCRSTHFNISEFGYRSVGRDQPWPPRPDRLNIFFFGGSTALGYNVEDSHSIPHLLQSKIAAIRPEAEVYNFGSGNYSSRHEFLRLLNFIDLNCAPQVAIFLDGYNDSFYALGNLDLVHILDRLYQGEKRRRRKSYWPAIADYALESLAARRNPMPSAHTKLIDSSDPDVLALASDASIAHFLDQSSRFLGAADLPPGGARLAETVWNRYLDSVSCIRALTHRHNVLPLFIWQPVPFFAARPEHRIVEPLYRFFRNGGFAASIYHWVHDRGFPGMNDSEDFFDISLAAQDMDGVLYLDICHYTHRFSNRIADLLLARLMDMLDFISRSEDTAP